tara:strand:+ start:81683 stop:85054 length:3372 start_codon:yes stop_codon:yes gene_type:complete
MTNKIGAAILSVGMFVALVAPMSAHAALSEAQIQSILSLLTSFGADASTISNVDASLRGQAPTGGNNGGSSASVCPYTWTRSLTTGDSGADVLALQQFLNSDAATSIAASGVGSAGNETDYFGGLTASAVAKFQDKYASEVLAPVGLSAGTGYFGSSTRAKANALCVSGSGNNNGGGDNGGSAPVTGAGLSVALAAGSPNGVALVQGQALGELAQFTFTNNNSAAMDVTNLTFNRIGVSNDATLSNVYVYAGAERLTDSAAVSSSQFSYNAPAGIFTIPAGSSKTVSVRADIATSTNGEQVGVSLVSVGATGALNSGVSFPITGGIQTISSATLATVDFNTTTLPSASTMTAQDDYVVWQNTTTVGTRAVNLETFSLRNIGSIDKGDIKNFRLLVDGVQVGSAVAAIGNDDYVVWDFSASPKRLETGGRTIKVMADIVDGANETFQFSLRRASDARFVDTQVGQPVLSTANGSSFSARSATQATVNAGSVSVTKANNSPSESVAVDSTNVKWASFELRASGEDVKVEDLDINVAATGSNGGLDNGKVFFNGVQVGSTKDLTEATDVNFTFGSSMILKAGEVAIVDIYADAKTTTAASYNSGDTVAVTLGTGSSNGQGQASLTSINVPGSDIAGNTITISSTSLTASKYSGYGNQTMIAGTNNAVLGSFTLTAGSVEGANINTLLVELSSAEAATITDLKLMNRNSGAQIGVTKASPSTSNSFSTNFDLAKSGSITIDVIGNIKSGANAGSWIATLDTTSGGTGLVTGSSVTTGSDLALQTITLGSGTLTATTGAGDPNADNVVAGQSSVHVGQFNFAAANSAYTVREAQIKIPNNASTSITDVTLKYTNTAGAVEEKTQALVTGAGAGTASFTGLDFYIPADSDRNVDVYVGIPTIASGATAGAAISVDLDYDTSFKAIDESGATSTSVGSADVSAAGTFYVRKSIPSFGAASKPTSVPTAGTALYEFTMSADSAGAIEWKQLSFDVATNSVTLTGFYLREKGETTNINDSTVNADGSNDVVIYAGTSTNSDVEQIAAGSSKTYQLFATAVTGWGTSGDSISINIIEDTSVIAVDSANDLLSGHNFVWSDRALTSHTTATNDWTNSYLVDDLSGGDAVSYSQS